MKDKPTRQELEIQISELKRQNEELKSIAIDFHENERFNTFDKENLKEVYVAPIASILTIWGFCFVKDDQSRLVLVNDAFVSYSNLQELKL